MILDEDDDLEFDFEASLPKDTDPAITGGEQLPNARLPGGGITATSGKKDFKRGTVVCRHWLRGLCMKGDTCEFLHQFDMTKMPECRWGMQCQLPECPFRHVPDEERVECTFYKQGFCIHGSICRYRHVKLAKEECPEVADFTLQDEIIDEEGVKRRKTQPANEFFKIALCKHWEKTGICPFGDECHFAHGKDELRAFPQKREGDSQGTTKPSRPENMPNQEGSSLYCLMISASYKNLAHSVHASKWCVSEDIFLMLQDANKRFDQIFLIFTVRNSQHFQGCAKIVRDSFTSLEIENNAHCPSDTTTDIECWKHVFNVEWLRICEIPYGMTADIYHPSTNQEIFACENGTDLGNDAGDRMLCLIYNQPIVKLHYRSIEDEDTLRGGAHELATRRYQASVIASGKPDLEPKWKVNGGGFLFACNNTTFDEVFGRLLVGMSKDHENQAQSVQPGTPLFLINMSDRHLFGIFEATTPAIINQEPSAFTRNPSVPSPFPVQVRFRIMLEAPPIPESDPTIKSIIGDRNLRIGPLTEDLTQQLADVFAARIGASNRGLMMENPAVPNVGPKVDGFIERFIVGIENDTEFFVCRKIIGQGGNNMKHIVNETQGKAKVHLRGRGSGVNDERESNEPLMLIVSSEDQESFEKACHLTKELLDSIHHEYQNFLMQHPGFNPMMQHGGQFGGRMPPPGWGDGGGRGGRGRGRGRGRPRNRGRGRGGPPPIPS